MTAPQQRPRVLRIVHSAAEEQQAEALDNLHPAALMLIVVVVGVLFGMAVVRWWGAS